MNTVYNEVEELLLCLSPFYYIDMKTVCSIGESLGLCEDDLSEIIHESRESLGHSNFENIDPVEAILKHVLKMARNRIKEITDYDFIDDFSGGGIEIYACRNALYKLYNYSEEARHELKEKVSPHLDTLMKDKWCHYFLGELKIRAE